EPGQGARMVLGPTAVAAGGFAGAGTAVRSMHHQPRQKPEVAKLEDAPDAPADVMDLVDVVPRERPAIPLTQDRIRSADLGALREHYRAEEERARQDEAKGETRRRIEALFPLADKRDGGPDMVSAFAEAELERRRRGPEIGPDVEPPEASEIDYDFDAARQDVARRRWLEQDETRPEPTPTETGRRAGERLEEALHPRQEEPAKDPTAPPVPALEELTPEGLNALPVAEVRRFAAHHGVATRKGSRNLPRTAIARELLRRREEAGFYEENAVQRRYQDAHADAFPAHLDTLPEQAGTETVRLSKEAAQRAQALSDVVRQLSGIQDRTQEQERTLAHALWELEHIRNATPTALPSGQGFDLVPDWKRRDLPVPSQAIPLGPAEDAPQAEAPEEAVQDVPDKTPVPPAPEASQQPEPLSLGDAEGAQEAMPAQVEPEAPIPTPEAPAVDDATPYTVAAHDAFLQRLREGQVSAEDVRGQVNRLLEAEEAVKAELGRQTVETLRKRLGPNARRGARRKRDVVQAVYGDMLMDYARDGSLSYQVLGDMPTSRTTALRDKAANYTDEDVAAYAQRVQKRREEGQELYQRYRRAMDDPQTLDDFRMLFRLRGEEAMTPEQRERYDELVASAQREKRAAARQQPEQDYAGTQGAQMSMQRTTHTRDGYDLFVVRLDRRVDRAAYRELLAQAKRLGGWYSRYAKGGAIPGFQFKTQDAAERFMSTAEGRAPEEGTPKAEAQVDKAPPAKVKRASRLREVAARLHETATQSLAADRRTNTAKRAREAAAQEDSARRELALAATMQSIADAIERGETSHLADISQKVQVQTLVSALKRAAYKRPSGKRSDRSDDRFEAEDIVFAELPKVRAHREILHSLAERLDGIRGGKGLAKRLRARAARTDNQGMYTFAGANELDLARQVIAKLAPLGDKYLGWQLREPLQVRKRLTRMGITSDEALRATLREFLSHYVPPGQESPTRRAERELVGRKIPGFFPTPAPVVRQMLETADIKGGMRVLEPSAGKGNIADAVKEQHPDAHLDVVETVDALRSILEGKGHTLVGRDFLKHSGTLYDRIIMNPPFENGQEREHVRHAYSLLKPGGRLVSVMSSGPFFREQKADAAFRDWLEEQGGIHEAL
ncbi:methyltransferase, partial [Desulfobaculum sp.]